MSSSLSNPETVLFYRECQAPPPVAHLVLSFWEFTARSGNNAPIMHEVFPDGCISLIHRQNKKLNINAFSTNSHHTATRVVPVFDGDVLWAIRLSPAACARVLDTDPASWKMVFWREEDEPFGIFDADLLAQLDPCTSLEEAIAVFIARLEKLRIRREDLDQKVIAAISMIEEKRGEMRISALAEELGLSVRQFERRFKRSAGLSPKQYARARRFRSAAAALATGETVNWADRAAEMGFADQAHLTHEFSSLSGRSPKAFAEKVKKIDHGKLV
jgi:AraC-like DNA-binding protein